MTERVEADGSKTTIVDTVSVLENGIKVSKTHSTTVSLGGIFKSSIETVTTTEPAMLTLNYSVKTVQE
jgi:hypothetical protein